MNYFFNYINFLSPPITLFHLEWRTHTSQLGGIFVILILTISLFYISFFLNDLINHKKITSYIFHKKFEFEAGYYSFNSSSIFNFIQIYARENRGYFDKFNSKYIRAYTTYVQTNFYIFYIYMIIGYLIHVEKILIIKI